MNEYFQSCITILQPGFEAVIVSGYICYYIRVKGNNLYKGFKSADSLWTSLQNGMIQFIQQNNGSATFYSNRNTTARPHWEDVEDYLKDNIDFRELKRRLGC